MKSISSRRFLLSFLSFLVAVTCFIPANLVRAVTIPDVIQDYYRQAIVSVAKEQVGKKYVFGSRGPDTFDCSGLSWYVYKKCGYYISSCDAAAQAEGMDNAGLVVTSMKQGYLSFYNYNKKTNNRYLDIDHVSIYIGYGYMIDGSSSQGKVVKREYTVMANDIVLKARPATYL